VKCCSQFSSSTVTGMSYFVLIHYIVICCYCSRDAMLINVHFHAHYSVPAYIAEMEMGDGAVAGGYQGSTAASTAQVKQVHVTKYDILLHRYGCLSRVISVVTGYIHCDSSC